MLQKISKYIYLCLLVAVGSVYFLNKQVSFSSFFTTRRSTSFVESELQVPTSNSTPVPQTPFSITPQNPLFVEAGKPMEADQVSQVSDSQAATTIPSSEELIGTTTIEGNVQVLKTTYSSYNDILPNEFTVKMGIPVRLEITVKDDGIGCMSSIMVPGYSRPILLTANEPITIEFTPRDKGELPITCAMGMPRGVIKVNT